MTEQEDSHFRVSPSTCPNCQKLLDGATNLSEGGGPKEGDFSLCMYCATLLRFDSGLNLLRATTEDLAILETLNPGKYKLLIKAQKLIQELLLVKSKQN